MDEDLERRFVDEAIWATSISPRELVVDERRAIEAVEQLSAAGVEEVAWEGWLLHADGRCGHSTAHQGTSDFFSIPECIQTIRLSAAEYAAAPEQPGALLYFCLAAGPTAHP